MMVESKSVMRRKKQMAQTKTLEETIQYLDEQIKYAECIKRHLISCQQIEWERDVALQQLKEHGITFGMKD